MGSNSKHPKIEEDRISNLPATISCFYGKHYPHWLMNEVPLSVSPDLQKIDMKNFRGEDMELDIARYFLEKVKSLTKLLISYSSKITKEKEAEISKQLLMVNGGLSYSDRISDGFYNILGMNPYLWAMCNDSDEGGRLPSLVSLKGIEHGDTSMEVVLVDRYGDSRLRELEDKAQDLYFSVENAHTLTVELAKLVAVYMGGSFPVEQGELHLRWKLDSMRLRDLQKCVVVPVTNMSMGLCRHRAILFKEVKEQMAKNEAQMAKYEERLHLLFQQGQLNLNLIGAQNVSDQGSFTPPSKMISDGVNHKV